MSNTQLDLYVTSSPHLSNSKLSTRWIMLDVIIGLVPVIGMSFYVFRWYAVWQIGLCLISCLTAEAVFESMRGRRPHLEDCSAIVTALILALSLPWSAPWYVSVVG
ncbi:MAG: RnfABCDGE type electron transport complex subunit D, partial [Thermoguttaceae bacterium]|nr:RnfABCDGE type electron transport complex subunit D [Thermoguttaceae bacterium]